MAESDKKPEGRLFQNISKGFAEFLLKISITKRNINEGEFILLFYPKCSGKKWRANEPVKLYFHNFRMGVRIK